MLHLKNNQTKNMIQTIKLDFIVYIMIIILFIIISSSIGQDYSALRRRLEYLNDIEEISWVEYQDTNIYIGFLGLPRDFGLIVRAAALHGNRALGFGVHVWAMRAADRGLLFDGRWHPYCEATARHGKVQSSSCP